MIIMCPHCSGLNRVPNEKLNGSITCGKCKGNLLVDTPLEMTGEQFTQALHKTDQPLIVDFWAPGCAPCKSFAPTFSQAAKLNKLNIRFVKINTKIEQQIAVQYNIRSIPTLVTFKSGKEIMRVSGAMDLGGLTRWINEHLL